MRTSTKWCQSALAEMETSFTRPFNQSLSQSGKVAITLINLISFSIINDQNKQYKQNTKKKTNSTNCNKRKNKKSRDSSWAKGKPKGKTKTIALKHNCYFAPSPL